MACRKLVPTWNVIQHNTRALPTIIGSRHYAKSTPPEKEAEIKTVTHTGQVFAPDDYRNVRFTNASRYVNDKFAIDLIAEEPPKEVTDRVVSCDGGDPPLGHPKVYINLDKPGPHACGYCGLRFVKKEGHH